MVSETVLLLEVVSDRDLQPRSLAPLEGVLIVADERLERALSAILVLPVPGRRGILAVFHEGEERPPRLVAFADELLSGGGAEDTLVLHTVFVGVDVPHVSIVEEVLAAVVGEFVPQRSGRVQHLVEDQLVSLREGADSEDVDPPHYRE